MLHPSHLLRTAAQLLSRSGAFRCPCRNVSVKTGGWKTKKVPQRYLGQPSPFTHPHLIKHGEVTPGLTQTEFELRRQRLASLIEAHSVRLSGPSRASDSSHIVIVLSHPTRYMTNDIPYPFHQNQDFLYLTGVLEPDSALVMFGSGRPDHAALFVPRRDPARELWDGPRSGRDGAAALTGLERVHCIEELGTVLKSLKGKPDISSNVSSMCGGALVNSNKAIIHPLLTVKHGGGSIMNWGCMSAFTLGSRFPTCTLAARRFCPHHVGHYLGMDVHDTPELSRSQPLQPGMAITIEPGLYFSEEDESCPERFRGLGVRIEDDVVIREEGGPLILSEHTPKTAADVERACAQRE
uniref:X-prolyl aminopeptidase 3, mitochondrial n=1 Tax=Astyanax mexicanus TaxID=7994 RepID=A0A8B9HCK8_ASTMX